MLQSTFLVNLKGILLFPGFLSHMRNSWITSRNWLLHYFHRYWVLLITTRRERIIYHIAIVDAENLFRLVDIRDFHQKLFLGPMCFSALCDLPICVFAWVWGKLYETSTNRNYCSSKQLHSYWKIVTNKLLWRSLLCLLHILLLAKCVFGRREEPRKLHNVGNLLTFDCLTHL